ncbi:MAG: nitronate monooxygenase [Thermoanaerobaculia bacterium]|nr:nitronate monooxygenase [Thermoanaerobaculia bacterium]
MGHPTIIQGGMGVAVSSWQLAQSVAKTGQLGVVSGTALDTVLVRRLQLGDLDGDARRVMAQFPIPDVAEQVLEKWFIEGGKDPDAPFALIPKPKFPLRRDFLELLAIGNYVEVMLAKEGHEGVVGINFLEKIQIPTLASLYGAMLAGVNYVLMGAGIPREIPGAMDAFAEGRPAFLSITVDGAQKGDDFKLTLDPAEFGWPRPVHRPYFLAIVASVSLATMLSRKASGHVDGFVIEREKAGGHNAPPRGRMQLDERGEPIYGPRDIVDLNQIHELGRPFWLAGACADRASIEEVLALGGNGVQIGTTFALCRESGLDPEIRAELLAGAAVGGPKVRTDPLASPTGFPFKVVELEGTMADQAVYESRDRICDLGYLRTPFRKENGGVGFRCASEPIKSFIAKGGEEQETVGRRCLCNGLLSTVSIGQSLKGGGREIPIVTSGDDYTLAQKLMELHGGTYSAADVIDHLMGVDLAAAESSVRSEASTVEAATLPTP